MTTYTLKLFKLCPGTTVRMGNGNLSLDLGDDIAAVRYAKSDESGALGPDDAVELWTEDGRLLWESHPPQPKRPADVNRLAKSIVDIATRED
jgi:hypothetical protein